MKEYKKGPPWEPEGPGSHILGFGNVTVSYFYSEHIPQEEYLFRMFAAPTFPVSVVTVSSRRILKV
jgi:hypothetical protein